VRIVRFKLRIDSKDKVRVKVRVKAKGKVRLRDKANKPSRLPQLLLRPVAVVVVVAAEEGVVEHEPQVRRPTPVQPDGHVPDSGIAS